MIMKILPFEEFLQSQTDDKLKLKTDGVSVNLKENPNYHDFQNDQLLVWQ
ncbi:hypothetical protein FACS1894132_00060 [Clostridia bacterium]|nr:hypothetical protein FACS1894132_00060 [Clostridia bacterium]